MQIREHFFPESAEEALALLAKEQGKARLIAGGTDLVVSLHEGKQPCEVLVDIARIPDLSGIEPLDGSGKVRLGARVTMAHVERSGELARRATALAEGCAWVGGPQIRNRATAVGNVVSAQPAADAALPLFALDAVLLVTSPAGARELPIEQAYRKSGGSTIDPTREIVTAIVFRLHDREEASAYTRMMRRKALTLPMLGCAVRLRRAGGELREARIVVGPVAAVPLRMREAEGLLCEGTYCAERVDLAAEAAAAAAEPRDSVFRGPAAYRKEMVKVMVRQTIETVWSRLPAERPRDR
jgi:carbon-monoxide dehydrogenase medium subunit